MPPNPARCRSRGAKSAGKTSASQVDNTASTDISSSQALTRSAPKPNGDTMSITAAIITTDTITSLTDPVDHLLDAMFTAQTQFGQITWDTLASDAAHGTYRDPSGNPTPITVVDTSATATLLATVTGWINGR